MKISIGLNTLDITINRSRRRTIGIIIDNQGNVKVACPVFTTDKRIRELIQQKSPWITKKLLELEQRPQIIQKKYIDGEQLLFLGEKYTLRLIQDNRREKPYVVQNNSNIEILYKNSITTDDIISTLKKWYTKQFKAIIMRRIASYSETIGVSPNKVTVRLQKSRWGSCSSKGNINLNLRLILAPMKVIDYVIVHELCHMHEMNHSKRFWQLVQNYYPDYKECKAWLKVNGSTLIPYL